MTERSRNLDVKPVAFKPVHPHSLCLCRNK